MWGTNENRIRYELIKCCVWVAYIAVKTRETRLRWFCQCMIRGSERGEKTVEEMNRQYIEPMGVCKDGGWTCVIAGEGGGRSVKVDWLG